MKFKLVYVGEVKINPKKRSQHLQDIRDILSPQLKRLSEISPYNEIKSRLEKKGKAIKTVGGVKFFPLITPDLNLLAELDIQILHPELLETPRADIDNRMKTLLDALKRPQSSHEISEHMNKKDVCYTLLDDDHLVTKMTINTSHLLYKDAVQKRNHDYELLIIITVNIKASKGTPDNLAVIV
ncbi:MAG: hypothetical protein IJ473_00375 [Alphaproteobacteria bacterium]|nr:hypothetical protein [Alphaproteobacteria bacterium]MBQ8660025.1 hypothetical protein [Alphaproteobacteria bacterium]